MRREDLRNTDLEAQPHLPQHVDGDDDRSDVQPGVTRVRQDHGVCGSSERERPVGHIVSHCGLVGFPHSTTRTPRNAAASSGTRCGSILACPTRRPLPPEDEHHRARRPRPRRLLVTVLAVVVVGAGLVVVLPRLRTGQSAGSTSADQPPHYVDESATSGIDHRYDGKFEFFVGGGVAAFDCNGDGRDELYVAGGTTPAGLYLNQSPIGGALKFAPKASPITDLTDVTGAYPIDIDSDGTMDLVVLRRNGNHVLRGLGNCAFEDADRGARRRARQRLDRRLQRSVGGHQPAAHARLRQLPRARRRHVRRQPPRAA